MGLLDEIGSLAGGGGAVQTLEKLAAGRGNFTDAASPDHQDFQSMVGGAAPGVLQQVFAGVVREMSPQQYADHLSPAAGGANPFGSLGSGALATIASSLLGQLAGAGHSGQSLLGRIPGLQTTDPGQMGPDQVAALARYTQQNHPDLFGQAAAQVGQQQPGLLGAFLGKGGLAAGAAALASHLIGSR